jgi:hypothetical protein
MSCNPDGRKRNPDGKRGVPDDRRSGPDGGIECGVSSVIALFFLLCPVIVI